MNAEAQKQFFDHVMKLVSAQASGNRLDKKMLADLQTFFQWGFITLKQREVLESVYRGG